MRELFSCGKQKTSIRLIPTFKFQVDVAGHDGLRNGRAGILARQRRGGSHGSCPKQRAYDELLASYIERVHKGRMPLLHANGPLAEHTKRIDTRMRSDRKHTGSNRAINMQVAKYLSEANRYAHIRNTQETGLVCCMPWLQILAVSLL